MHLHFTATESIYVETMRGCLERYVRPVAFYSDKYNVFRSSYAGMTGAEA
ncbi:hypothetical protein [Burkholderia sp. Ac-20344]|nr:hypothetical protein [Burkholderia sp. Ac-20344]